MTTEVLLPRQQGPKGVFSTQQTGNPSDIMVAILSGDSTKGFPKSVPNFGVGTVLQYTHPVICGLTAVHFEMGGA